jgi:hypothetical protein
MAGQASESTEDNKSGGEDQQPKGGDKKREIRAVSTRTDSEGISFAVLM